MAVVKVTSTVGATCHYWLAAQAIEDTAGAGVSVANIVHGQIAPDKDGTPATLELYLDNAYRWDLDFRFRGAAPIVFEGFDPGTGGDLLTLLAAQGWTAL